MNKRIVLESYKATCLLLDWVTTLAAEDLAYELLPSGTDLEKWAFVEYLSRPEVVSYTQIVMGSGCCKSWLAWSHGGHHRTDLRLWSESAPLCL